MKRGHTAQEDAPLTQQLLIDGVLPSLAPLLVSFPGKREPLCEVAAWLRWAR